MIIDTHVHFSTSEGFMKALLKECDRLGIDKVCLIGDGEDLKKAAREAPDRILTMAIVRLGKYYPSIVDKLKDEGMNGLKIIKPAYCYDDERAFPVYERAEANKMPILFHLGIISRKDDFDIVSSNWMRPIYLDHIARLFPNLKIIGAHLGNPWYEEASMSARWNSNLWFDLSGSTLKKKTPEFIRSLLWWDKPRHPYQPHGGKHPYEKIVFGTDVAIDWMEDVMNDYRKLCDELDIPEEYRKKIFGLNAAEIFELPISS